MDEKLARIETLARSMPIDQDEYAVGLAVDILEEIHGLAAGQLMTAVDAAGRWRSRTVGEVLDQLRA